MSSNKRLSNEIKKEVADSAKKSKSVTGTLIFLVIILLP